MQRAKSMSSLLPDLSSQADAVPTSVINTVGHTLIPLGLFSSIVGLLPAIAALLVTCLGAIFYCIQIYESKTFTHWRMNHIMRRKARKLMKLRAKEKIVVAKIAAIETMKTARSEADQLLIEARAAAATLAAHSPVAIAEKQNPTI